MESTTHLLFGDDVDRRLGWKPGRAVRLARQRRLPHLILPDGSIRFDWPNIQSLIVRVNVLTVEEVARA
jgi:hypothetical protein